MTSGVFVVDDDPVFRDLARRMLRCAGLTVLGEAGTVATAMEAVRELEPSAVLVDVGLPDGDGVTLATHLTGLPWRPSVGEDDVLMREGVARLLTEGGFEVVGQAGDADGLLRKALAHSPDVVVADVQMPPGHGDDGLLAALELRRRRPEVGVLVLSQYYEEQYALDLIGDRPEGVGYLLKERVGDVETFLQSVARVAAGGSALDPEVVGRMLGRRRASGPLERLSKREREVLALMAEGKSNQGIAAALVVSDAAVEKHVTAIFSKLGLGPTTTEHRRVRAVLTYLRG
jgi:DNA-binding NarL/FixJ family response regulator